MQMATRAPRKTMTANDYKEKLEKAKAALKALEEKAYATELEDLIKSQNIVSAFNAIKENAKDVSEIAILTAIAKACKVKRIVITEAEVKKRAPRKQKA
jgi:hypothetical protein